MRDIVIDWAPPKLAQQIRAVMGERATRDNALLLGIPVEKLGDIMFGLDEITPLLAVRLSRHFPPLDGRALYECQQQRLYELCRRYEAGEVRAMTLTRPDRDRVMA